MLIATYRNQLWHQRRRIHNHRRDWSDIVVKKYAAPWSTSLIVISTVITLILAGVAVLVAGDGRSWISALPVAILFGSLLFMVRGYSLTSDALLVHRLVWTTRLPLSSLRSAQAEPDAMRGSLRTFGNGGLFSFTGRYTNGKLGGYSAYVTDPRRAVVLDFGTRKVVVSPAVPEEFVNDIRHFATAG